LRGAPLASARLSKRAALAAVIALGAILGVVLLNLSKSPPKAPDKDTTQAKGDLQPALNAARSLTKDVPDIVAEPKQVRPAPPPLAQAAPPLQAKPRALSSADEARLADSALPQFSRSQTAGIQPEVEGMSAHYDGPAQAEDAAPASGTDALGAAADTAVRLSGLPGPGDRPALNNAGRLIATAAQSGEPDLNRQSEKIAFLEKPRKSAYLNARLAAPVSPFELKTGTVIPSVMISAMNSDLPGEVVAQVSQNVYDTASGNHLLIPQGARLFGHYDSKVTFGQNRLLVSWDRLIYPDSSTLELGGMSGHDQEGDAGFEDRVNSHYGRIFGWALLTSVLSAGFQLSQPQQASSLALPSNQQVAAAAVGQQMAQLGADLARRNMEVQPTIEIRKGYRFNVMVNKDIVFPGSYQP